MLKPYFSLALVLLILLGTLRGGATSVSKLVAGNAIPPLAYAMWVSLIAAGLLTVMGYARSRQPPPIIRHFRRLSVYSVVGVALPNVIFFHVVRNIPAGTMAVLLTLTPMVTYALVVLLRLEPLAPLRIAGLALGFCGALIIAMPQVVGGITVDGWVFVGMLCPLGYASMSVYISRHPMADCHPISLAAGTHSIAFLVLLPLAVANGDFFLPGRHPVAVEALIVLHGVIAAVAYSLFFKIVGLAGPVFYSFSAYIVALTGIGWGRIIFGETHPRHFWLAVLLIFIGLAVINSRRGRKTTLSDQIESGRTGK